MNSGLESAFRALGLLRVTKPTPGLGVETRMCSYEGDSVEYGRTMRGIVDGAKDLCEREMDLAHLRAYIVGFWQAAGPHKASEKSQESS